MALRRQEVFAIGIKAFWDEGLGFYPLGRVVAQFTHHDGHHVTLAYLQLLTLHILRHSDRAGVVDGRIHSQGFTKAICIELHVLIVLIVDKGEDIQLSKLLAHFEFALFVELLQVRLNYHLIELIKDFLLVFRVLAEGENEILSSYG